MNSAHVHRNLRKTIMCEKIKSRAQKNRMYGHHTWSNLCSSEGIKVAAAPGSSQSVAQPLQNFRKSKLLVSTATVWTGYRWYLWIRCPQDSENRKIDALGASPAPPNPQTMRETMY